MKMLTALTFLIPILLAANACVNGSVGVRPLVVEGDYCRIAKPIYYDMDKDTPETIRQIETHNSRFVCVCELDCPKPSSDTTQP